MLTDLLNRYSGIATSLVLDLVAIFLMTHFLYFRRHWRADLLLPALVLRRTEHRHLRDDVGAHPSAGGHRGGLRPVRDPLDHSAAVERLRSA